MRLINDYHKKKSLFCSSFAFPNIGGTKMLRWGLRTAYTRVPRTPIRRMYLLNLVVLLLFVFLGLLLRLNMTLVLCLQNKVQHQHIFQSPMTRMPQQFILNSGKSFSYKPNLDPNFFWSHNWDGGQQERDTAKAAVLEAFPKAVVTTYCHDKVKIKNSVRRRRKKKGWETKKWKISSPSLDFLLEKLQ